MEKSQTESARRLVYVIAGVAATGGFLFGFDTGVISGALLFIKKEWTLTSLAQEMVVSAVLVGAILGATFAGKLADEFGRRLVIIAAALIFFLGSIGTALAPDYYWLILGRFVLGLAIGLSSCIVPLYISEISPPQVRGALVSLNQLAITVGIVASYVVAWWFSTWAHGWRYMFLTGIAPACCLCVGMLFLPRTPRWLMSKGREAEARMVLEKISGPIEADQAIMEMKAALEHENRTSYSDLFQPWLRQPLIIGIGLMMVQQLTGINTVIYYAPTIFQMAGIQSESAAIAATVVVGIVNVLFTIVSIWLLDRLGRKPLLSVGLAGMVVSLGVLGLAFQMTSILGKALVWVSIGSLLVYIASFAVSLGPIAWLVISEIYPIRVRGLGMSVATVSNWGFNFLVALTFLSFVDAVGPARAFWLYGLLGILGWLFCRFCVPETKGHTLEEIEMHWLKGRSPLDL